MTKDSRIRTVPRSEQTVLRVLFKLQGIGAIPKDEPWKGFSMGVIIPLSVRKGDDFEVVGRRRKILVEAESYHVEMTLETEHQVPGLPAEEESEQSSWQVTSLSIWNKSFRPYVDIRLGDPQSIGFLFKLGEKS